MMKYIYILLISLFLPNVALPQDFDSKNGVRYHQIVVKLKAENRFLLSQNGIDAPEFQEISNQVGIHSFKLVFPKHSVLIERFNCRGEAQVDLSLIAQFSYNYDMDEMMLSKQLLNTGLFEYAEPRAENNFFFSVNDPLASKQFYLAKMQVYDAWDIEKGDSNVIIGITDSGTDRLHNDLKKNTYFNSLDTLDGLDNDNDGFIDNYWGWDLGSNDYDPQWYPIGHGVFVSGISSATQNNGIGVAGIAYNNKFMPIKIDDTSGYLTHDYEGIVYAADHGCSIINCSWGGTLPGQFGQDVINYATFNKNALVVAACGNSNNNKNMYPAAYNNVLSCAATDSLDQKSSISSYGNKVDIAAPGAWVYSTWISNSYSASSGTSFSAPCVSAAAALVKSKFPNLSALQIAEQLKVTSDNIDTISYNNPYNYLLGNGRLNVFRALTDTLLPSIVLQNCSIMVANDTMTIIAGFKNFLATTSANAKVKLTLDSIVFTPIINEFILGQLVTFDTISNTNSEFKFKINYPLNLGFETMLRFQYSDTNYRGYDYWPFKAKNDFLNIDTNAITLSVAANSSFGFTNYAQTSGLGLLYANNPVSLVNCAGLIIGNSTGKVSDNIYNESTYSTDFCGINVPYYVSNFKLGDQEIRTHFNDDSAGVTTLHLDVVQSTYAYNLPALDKVVFVKYTITNNGNLSLNTLYAGLYADFDLKRSSFNNAKYDSILKLAYTESFFGGSCAGIMELKSAAPLFAYNFANDGFDNSINIYDGFMDFEKYQALQTHRPNAITTPGAQKDVSSLLSSGPYVLNPNQNINLVYAFVVGNNLQDLFQAAQNARNQYFGSGIETVLNAEFSASLSPNPCYDKFALRINSDKSLKMWINVYDIYGKLIISDQVQTLGQSVFEFDTEMLNKGVYLIKIETQNSTKTLKLIKQ